MRKLVLLAVSSAILGACSITPIPTTQPQRSSGVLGTLELQFGGDSDPVFQASNSLRTAALTPKPDSSITATFVSFVTRDEGGVRTLTAVYDLKNNTNTAFQNLSLVAYAKTGNSNSSALKSINAFNGAPSSSNVYGVKPAQGTNGSVTVSEFNSDLQVYTQAEATAFTTAAQTAGVMTVTEYALEYGFVARQSGSSHLRSIAPNATGRVSLSMRIPTSADVTSGTRFVMTFIVADNDAAHVVQSLEEPVSGADAIARAAAVGSGTEVRLLPTSTSSASPRLLLNPRTAGTIATPLGRLFTGSLPYTQLNINAAIPAGFSEFTPPSYGAAVTRTFAIPSFDGKTSKVTLRTKVTHQTRGDVRIRLVNPSSTTVTLYEDPAALFATNMNVTFDDAATTTVATACYNNSNTSCVGSVKPQNALSALTGTAVSGTWTVLVDDGYTPDSGTLDELELVVTVGP